MQAHVYTECAAIWNPIHTERAYALASGLPDIILHGSCTWAMALQRLAADHAPKSPLPFRRFAARFSGMVVPGRSIVLEASPPKDGRIAFALRNAEGQLALSHGVAELA
jgi:acyl dehydratase